MIEEGEPMALGDRDDDGLYALLDNIKAMENDIRRLRHVESLMERAEWFLRNMPALPTDGAELLEDICRARSEPR